MSGGPSARQRKVGYLLQAEISEIVRDKIRDPRLGFLTVIDVTVSRDLRHASVFVSVLGNEEEGAVALGILNRASGFVRSELGGRVELKHVPELRFKIDRSAEHGVHISEMLKKLFDSH